MAQNFNSLKASSLIKNDRQTINDNFDAVRSCHSGTAYPTTELVAGMLFFNTSTKKLYEYNGSAWVQILDLSSGTAVAPKSGNADSATKATGDKNGKDITTYVAKLEQDTNNKFVIRVYNGANTLITTITIPETDVDVMTGASASSAGKVGLVPQPKAGDNDKFLCGDGSFKEAGKVKSVNGKTGDVVVGEVTNLSISGKTITVTFADGTTKTLTTQDTGVTPTSYITEKGGSANSWYRKYSDGWIIAGGYANRPQSSNGRVAQTITLPIAFPNTSYVGVANTNSGSGTEYALSIKNKSTTSFQIQSTQAATTFNRNWLAIAYVA